MIESNYLAETASPQQIQKPEKKAEISLEPTERVLGTVRDLDRNDVYYFTGNYYVTGDRPRQGYIRGKWCNSIVY